jgi:hypothetical protein
MIYINFISLPSDKFVGNVGFNLEDHSLVITFSEAIIFKNNLNSYFSVVELRGIQLKFIKN